MPKHLDELDVAQISQQLENGEALSWYQGMLLLRLLREEPRVLQQYTPEQEGKPYPRVLRGRFYIPPAVPVKSVGGLWINRYSVSRFLPLSGFEIAEGGA